MGRLVMSKILAFDKIYQYDTLESGIAVTVKLFANNNFREIRVKIGTGASYCIFERKHAERLGIDVES